MQPTREIKEYVTHVAGDRQISLGAHGVSMCVCVLVNPVPWYGIGLVSSFPVVLKDF